MPNWVVERVYFMRQKQDYAWMPGGVTNVIMINRGDNMHVMTSCMDENMIEEDDGLGLVDEEPENVTDTCPFGLNETKPIVIDDL